MQSQRTSSRRFRARRDRRRKGTNLGLGDGPLARLLQLLDGSGILSKILLATDEDDGEVGAEVQDLRDPLRKQSERRSRERERRRNEVEGGRGGREREGLRYERIGDGGKRMGGRSKGRGDEEGVGLRRKRREEVSQLARARRERGDRRGARRSVIDGGRGDILVCWKA